jgi:hypothetical protein
MEGLNAGQYTHDHNTGIRCSFREFATSIAMLAPQNE